MIEQKLKREKQKSEYANKTLDRKGRVLANDISAI